MKKINQDILKRYENEILSSELGEGDLKKRLLKGLEEVLSGIEFPEKTEIGKSKKNPSTAISLHDLRQIANANGSTKLAIKAYGAFLHSNINSYGDIVKEVSEYFKIIGARPDHYKESIERYFLNMRNVGKKIAPIMIQYVQSIVPKEEFFK